MTRLYSYVCSLHVCVHSSTYCKQFWIYVWLRLRFLMIYMFLWTLLKYSLQVLVSPLWRPQANKVNFCVLRLSSPPPTPPTPPLLLSAAPSPPLVLSVSLSVCLSVSISHSLALVTWSAVTEQDAHFRAAADVFKKLHYSTNRACKWTTSCSRNHSWCPATEKRRVFVENHRRPQQQHRVHSPVGSPELRHQQSAIKPTYRPLQKEAPESSVTRQEENRGEDSSNEAPTTPNE